MLNGFTSIEAFIKQKDPILAVKKDKLRLSVL